MYELIQVSPTCYYLDCPAKVGVVLTGESEAVLIDSGSDKDAAKKVLRALQEKGRSLKAVFLTHSHADHSGGSRLLCDRTGCAVYAPGVDAGVVSNPILEPSMLYGGFPPDALRNKFLMASACPALPLTEAALPDGLAAVPLPGHCYDMVGFRSADGVVYLADCLSSRETLDKYGLAYNYDIAACLETLERVKAMEGRIFVPAHADVTEDIAPLAQYNIDCILSACERILSLCREPVCFDLLLKKLFDSYGLALSFQQYALVGSTVRSYLAYLLKQGRAEYLFSDNMMLWHSV